jgi:hypothetical protein
VQHLSQRLGVMANTYPDTFIASHCHKRSPVGGD